MKRIIDIDDNDYELINKTVITLDLNTAFHGKEKDKELTFAVFDLVKALKNGTPYNPTIWIQIKMRTGTDEEYEEFCKYGDCPREDFRIFECPMPDDDQEVLITTRLGDVCTDIWHSEIDCSWFEDHEDIDDVIAWMPKPERYQEEYEEVKNERSEKM